MARKQFNANHSAERAPFQANDCQRTAFAMVSHSFRSGSQRTVCLFGLSPLNNLKMRRLHLLRSLLRSIRLSLSANLSLALGGTIRKRAPALRAPFRPLLRPAKRERERREENGREMGRKTCSFRRRLPLLSSELPPTAQMFARDCGADYVRANNGQAFVECYFAPDTSKRPNGLCIRAQSFSFSLFWPAALPKAN